MAIGSEGMAFAMDLVWVRSAESLEDKVAEDSDQVRAAKVEDSFPHSLPVCSVAPQIPSMVEVEDLGRDRVDHAEEGA